MSRLRVHCFAISLDGYGAGPHQDATHPLGVGGLALHDWVWKTRTFQKAFGEGQGETGVDDDFVARGFENLGAWILGRNMFGPVRGPWTDDTWKGWWGEDPPYHCDVFVLTHHARSPIEMSGGTTFYFVTDGIEGALERARASARGQDVRLGGGVRPELSMRCTLPSALWCLGPGSLSSWASMPRPWAMPALGTWQVPALPISC